MLSGRKCGTPKLVAALLCFAATAIPAAAQRAETQPQLVDSVRYNGETLTFRVERAKRSKEFVFAGWNFGAKLVTERARDKHGNLYIVVPGTDYAAQGHEAFTHNRLISYVPERERTTTWDVYWVVVLDPTLEGDFRSERELIVGLQDTFDPTGIDFDELRSAPVLRQHLRIASFEALESLRTKDGLLPRVLIVSAGFSVRARVVESAPPSLARGAMPTAMPARPLKRD